MTFKKIILSFAFVFIVFVANAQFNLLGATYYQNQYLANPAMAGFENGSRLNIGFNKQMNDIPGSPTAQFISAEHQYKKAGFGINAYNDKSGLIKRTRVVGTFAYHIPLNNESQQLHFGVSLGTHNERINMDDINGNISDLAAQRFNERPGVLDGDFGAAYTTGKLTVQGAIPNLKNFFKRDLYNSANWNTFFTAISYKIMTDSTKNAFVIEPKLSYRGVKGFDDILDVGANISLASKNVYGMVMYHSTNSVSFGLGLNYKQIAVLGIYTTGTSALRGYSNGTFEIGLGYRLSSFKKE